jgi:hypothetical protein
MSIFDRFRRQREEETEPDEATQRLLERARALPREVEPARDLWSGIENRIRSAEAPKTVSAPTSGLLFGVFPRPALAAALGVTLVAATAAITLWIAQPALPTADSDLRQLANELRARDGVAGVHESLLAILEESQAGLPEEALQALEDNVRQIDRALAELSIALRQHPEHPELRFLLAETYRREADLLERMERWTRPTSGENS